MSIATPADSRKSRSYGTTPIKRHRRTAEQMDSVLGSIKGILDAEDGQITIRHLFYRLVGLAVIPKTEVAYKGLCGHLSKWRRSGDIAWDSFSDNTRWHISPTTYEGVHDALDQTVRTYRRNLWSSQPFYVETWVEKDAIAGIVSDTANTFGVPVFVARGFASLSSLYSAADTFRTWTRKGKQVVIIHLGDYDPSGVAAGQAALNTLREDFDVDLEFIRAAVTPEQIEGLNLPTRPTKMGSTHAKHWTGGESVELDSMPPAELRRLVEDHITARIDVREWNALKQIELMERETLAAMGKAA